MVFKLSLVEPRGRADGEIFFIIVITHSGWTKRGIQSMATDLIRRGEFDFHLAKPVDPMIMVSIKSPRIYNFITLLFMVPFAIYAVVKSGIPIGLDNILWFLFLGLIAFILYYFLQVLVITPAFWFIRLWTLGDIMNSMSAFMRYPANVFPGIFRTILTIVFPIITVSYIPSQILFYPPQIKNILFIIIITVFFGLLTRFIWHLGEKGYNSASS